MTTLSCLAKIVGITDETTPCLTAGLTQQERDDLAVSVSGLYTDNLVGGVTMRALTQASICRNLAEISLGARENAIRQLSDDVRLILSQSYSPNRNTFTGDIGQNAFVRTLAENKRYVGIRIQPNDLSDGVLKVSGGRLTLSQSDTVTVSVIRADYGATTGEVIATFDVNAIAGTPVSFTQSLRMPLRHEGRAVEYYFVYDRLQTGSGTAVEGKDNRVSCNCGGAERKLATYCKTDGVGFDNPSALDLKSIDGYAHGLVLQADVRCDTEQFVCREYDENDAVSITLAHAAWYKAGELIIEEVLKSPEVNRYTMMQREFLWGKRNHFRKEYESRVLYLGSHGVIDVESTDCFICKDERMIFQTIIS